MSISTPVNYHYAVDREPDSVPVLLDRPLLRTRLELAHSLAHVAHFNSADYKVQLRGMAGRSASSDCAAAVLNQSQGETCVGVR